jgi:hypothetical protein
VACRAQQPAVVHHRRVQRPEILFCNHSGCCVRCSPATCPPGHGDAAARPPSTLTVSHARLLGTLGAPAASCTR